MASRIVMSMILVCCFLWVSYTLPVALSCDSCGRECASACGTRHFRTCCFNYLRKRSFVLPPPGLKLELWLEKSQIERAARSALVEETEKLQQSLLQHQHQLQVKHQEEQQILQQPEQQEHEPNTHDHIQNTLDQNDGGRIQLIYDA